MVLFIKKVGAMKRILVFWGIFLIGMTSHTLAAETVAVKTKAPKNKLVTFHYRTPESYDPQRSQSYRVLVYFGGRNTSGAEIVKNMNWSKWADRNEIFIIAPGFQDDNYWEPDEWSGRALFKALEQIRKKQNICTAKLLFYGYSAGSQCANLFPAWRPGNTCAWVSHACGVFHTPGNRMRNIPGLVTCGDADGARYIISRRFVENCRKNGTNILWKSFPNHPHDVPPGSVKLAQEFLAYHHERNRQDLGFPPPERRESDEKALFVGDDQDNLYYTATSPKAHNISLEDRVFFPHQRLADAWGKAAQ